MRHGNENILYMPTKQFHDGLKLSRSYMDNQQHNMPVWGECPYSLPPVANIIIFIRVPGTASAHHMYATSWQEKL